MFESIMIRHTAPPGAESTVDLGHLAESMLFYGKVRLALTRGSVKDLVGKLGPDLAIELVENPCIDSVYLNASFGIRSEDVGTANARHRPISLLIGAGPSGTDESTFQPETHYDVVHDVFAQAIGSRRRANRKANRFINQLRSHEPIEDIPSQAVEDWQREQYVRPAVAAVIAELAPTYTPPNDLRTELVPLADGWFRFDSNINWNALRAAHAAKTGAPSTLGPADLLTALVDVNEDLYLGAALDATLAQDRLGAQLLRIKCADLRRAADMQQTQIDQFQYLKVDSVHDIRTVINSGDRSFEEFLKVHGEAKPFRDWLDGQPPDANLVAAYSAETVTKHGFDKAPQRQLRWMLPTGGEVATAILHEADMMSRDVSAGTALALAAIGLIDKFVIERYKHGWRPSSFIDDELRPFVLRPFLRS